MSTKVVELTTIAREATAAYAEWHYHCDNDWSKGGMEVTLWDPIWHVSSYHSEAGCKLLYSVYWLIKHKAKTFDTRSSATTDRPRDVMCQSKSCELLHNSVGTTCTTSPEQSEVMELEGYTRPTYNKLVHSAMTHLTVVGVIHN